MVARDFKTEVIVDHDSKEKGNLEAGTGRRVTTRRGTLAVDSIPRFSLLQRIPRRLRFYLLFLTPFCCALYLFHTNTLFPRSTPSLAPYYYGGCSSSDFRLGIRDGKPIDGDIPSSHQLDESMYITNAIPPIKYSFRLAEGSTCPPPHVFTAGEACDLLSGFAAVIVTGDSFMRHIYSALLILLRDNLAGATNDHLNRQPPDDPNICAGERTFNDTAKYCRDVVESQLKRSQAPVCSGTVDGSYILSYHPDSNCQRAVGVDLDRFSKIGNQTAPIAIIQGFGAHFDYNVDFLTHYHRTLGHYLDANPRTKHRLVSTWAGPHSPNDMQPGWLRATQGPKGVHDYIVGFTERLPEKAPYANTLDFFNVTLGADHYDGVHLSYVGNMEKLQIWLNYLALVRREIDNDPEYWSYFDKPSSVNKHGWKEEMLLE
ncbi:hypothetical protein MNV49_004127 [Pseudohyphozyma bogoriensis]|nr:hypothetical protein MNV49_004127 [Pseudohyphozyma bogoriensis]